MAETKIIDIKINSNINATSKDVANLKGNLTNVNKETKELKGSLGGVTKALDDVSGGAVSSFGKFTSGLKDVSLGFKGVGTAIAASGLGLLVIIIGSIVTAFKASEAGEDKFAKLMGIIGQVTSKVIDTLAAFGEIVISVFENPKKAINDFAKLIKDNIVNRFTGLLELIPSLGKAIKQLFEGDFSGAAKTAADAAGKVALGVENITDKINSATRATKEYILELERQAKIGAQIAVQRDKAEDLERGLIVKRAEADRKIAELREKASLKDQFSLKERISLLQQAQAVENNITNQEIQAAKLLRDAKILENKQTRSNTAALVEEENLKAKVVQLETSRLNANRTLNRTIQSLRAENLADIASANEAEKKLDEQKWKDYGQRLKDANDLEIQERKSFNETIKGLTLENQDEQKNAFLDFINAEEEARQIELESRKVFEDAKYSIVNQGLTLLGSLAGKSKALATALLVVEKGLAISQVVTNAARGISQATSNLAAVPAFIGTVPNPAYAAQAVATAKGIATTKISAGLAIATILAQSVNKLGGSVGGGGGGGETAPSGGASPSFNVVGNSGVNQIAQTLSGQSEQAPIQAFVVAGAVTTAQGLNRNIINNASLG